MPVVSLTQVAGVMRLRVAMPGFNAANLALDPKFVVFDSADAGTQGIYMSGVTTITFPETQTVTVLATYPSLGYIPLAMVGEVTTTERTWFLDSGGVASAFRAIKELSTSTTQLRIVTEGGQTPPLQQVIHWTIFRVRAE